MGERKVLIGKVSIINIENSEEKAKIVKEVLANLPEWFGLADAVEEYIENARKSPLWLAKTEEDIIGFITLKETSKDTCEIHCMGIKRAYHRRGIGRILVEALEGFARDKYEYLQVKTVDEGYYSEYDKTVAFYKSLGFKKLEVFPFLWDKWNPCLILIKKI